MCLIRLHRTYLMLGQGSWEHFKSIIRKRKKKSFVFDNFLRAWRGWVVVKILRHRATDVGSRCLWLYSKTGKERLYLQNRAMRLCTSRLVLIWESWAKSVFSDCSWCICFLEMKSSVPVMYSLRNWSQFSESLKQALRHLKGFSVDALEF